ncbi:MAG: LamG domain-containing protein, partial [Gammaproteobacteria bacterium]|nr:LamG domain-containing protein [Gammaproteobacteria bacterium]
MSIADGDLLVYLKLDSVQRSVDGASDSVPNLAGKKQPATIVGNPKLVQDDKFGSCLRFNPNAAGTKSYLELEIPTDLFNNGWSYTSWVYIESEKAQFLSASPDFDFYIHADDISFNLVDQALEVSHKFKRNGWLHIAITVQDDGTTSIGIDGQIIKSKKIDNVIPTDSVNLKLGNISDEWIFSGKMAHVRIYNRALSTQEIQRQRSMDQSSVLDIRESSPLEFELWDEQQKPAIYVVGGEISHKLTVAIWNRDAKQQIVGFNALEEKQRNQLELIKIFESSRRVETAATYEQLIGFKGLDEGIKQKIIKLKKDAEAATTYKQLIELK